MSQEENVERLRRLYGEWAKGNLCTLEWLAAWDAYWMTAEEFIPRGDRVVVLMCLHARAPETDYALEQRVGAVWALREGKAVSVRFYDDADEALEAVGLRG